MPRVNPNQVTQRKLKIGVLMQQHLTSFVIGNTVDSRYSGAQKNPLYREKLDIVEFLLNKIIFGNPKKNCY